MPLASSLPTTGFLCPGTVDIWGQVIFCCWGAIPCIRGCLAASLTFSHLGAASAHSVVTTNNMSRHLPTLSRPGVQNQRQLRSTHLGEGSDKFDMYFAKSYVPGVLVPFPSLSLNGWYYFECEQKPSGRSTKTQCGRKHLNSR